MDVDQFDRVLGAAAVADDFDTLADAIRTQAAAEACSEGVVVVRSIRRQLERLVLAAEFPGWVLDLSDLESMADAGTDEERWVVLHTLKLTWQCLRKLEVENLLDGVHGGVGGTVH